MLSNPLHRYSPYNNASSSGLHSHLSQPHQGHQGHHGHNNPFDSFNHGSHYGMHQLQHHVGNPNPRGSGPLDRQGHQKQRPQPPGSSGKSSGTSGPVRRRISRACDQCNQLRTKCDGKNPCAHCVGKFFCSRSVLLIFGLRLTSLWLL